jgi:hypothetical protein
MYCTSDKVDFLLSQLNYEEIVRKNPYVGSRSVIGNMGSYTEIRHDNKLVAILHPDIFMRILKLNEA